MGCSTTEKILITGATGKIAFPIARALAQRNEVWGAARLRDAVRSGEIGGCRHHTDCARHEQGRLLGTARRFHLRLPRGGGYRRRRLGAVCRDERTELGRTAAPLPNRKGIRVLLDRVDLRLPRPAAVDRNGPARRATAGELQLLQGRRRSRVHLGCRAVPDSTHDHPDLLHLRTRRRSTGRPAGNDVGAQADSATPRQAQQLQPDLRGRLRRTRHQGHGSSRHATGRGELGRQ